MSTDIAQAARSGCGCGPGGGGCGCSGGGSDGVSGSQQYTYVRPRFFAGQLLCEEDLELLTAYGVAKSRLHNRYLFGSGVVCGLEVACDPCGGGHVRVRPGYALDCCGADIVVACPADIDVNALIRDLRTSRLGTDCGDPCAAPGTGSGSTETTGTPAAASTGTGTGTARTGGSRCYFLYIRYDETLAEPVAPYATDEPCGQQSCEPSRVREGFRFVLKCDPPSGPDDHVRTRMAACQPPPPDAELARQRERLERFAGSMRNAARLESAPAAFDRDAVKAVRAATAKLSRHQAAARLTPDDARAQAADVLELARALVRIDLQDQQTREQLLTDKAVRPVVKAARDALRDSAARLAAAPPDTWTDELDQETASQLLDQAPKIADPAADALVPVQARMLGQGLPLGPGTVSAIAEASAGIRAWLLRQLDSAANLADCELRAAVAAIAVPGQQAPDTVTEEAVAAAGEAGIKVQEALARYIADCQCNAVNPPCTPCTDTDVLLACLEVRDCEVVKVCNAVREYVISPAAVRYWMPPWLEVMYSWLERNCCTGHTIKPETKDATPQQISAPASMAFSTQSPAPAAVPDTFGLPGLFSVAGPAVPVPAAARGKTAAAARSAMSPDARQRRQGGQP